jgi:transcriptional regulator with XRE-family HTH domain
MAKTQKRGLRGRYPVKAAPPELPAELAPKTYHFGEWIDRLDRKASDVAKRAGIGKSYLSLLISGKKANPSEKVAFKIASELGIPLDSLRRRPPPRSEVEALKRLPPDQIAALGRYLEEREAQAPKRH